MILCSLPNTLVKTIWMAPISRYPPAATVLPAQLPFHTTVAVSCSVQIHRILVAATVASPACQVLLMLLSASSVQTHQTCPCLDRCLCTPCISGTLWITPSASTAGRQCQLLKPRLAATYRANTHAFPVAGKETHLQGAAL